jgi:spermidine synthase
MSEANPSVPVAAPANEPRPQEATAGWRLDAMAFATAGVTLFIQVLVHRIISAKLANNYAFLVIALTMLGFAFSGVVLSRALPAVLRHRRDVLSISAALFVVSLLLVCVFFYKADIPWSIRVARAEFFVDLARRLPLALPFALPFVFCGVILGVLLSSPDAVARRVYFFDLVGSALGAFVVIEAIGSVGVENGLLIGSGVLIVASLVCFRPRTAWAWGALGAAALLVVGLAVRRDAAFEMRFPEGTMLAEAQTPGSPMKLEHISWDPVARIEVSSIPPQSPEDMAYPSLIGSNRAFHQRFRKMLTQNNYAFTYAVDYDGRRETLVGIEETVYASAYQARTVPNPRVLVIGVGGGFDILTALAFEPTHVTGVEINSATVKLLRETYRNYFRHWVQDPRVTIVNAEGRNHLAGTTEKYDVLQLSGVDSYSGTPGAAHVFSESYLYTEEAFDLYLSRLNPQGILNVMRLEWFPPREMLRALTTAVAALRRAGIETPADHIVMITATNGRFTAMLVKKTPFLPEEIERLSQWVKGNAFLAITAGPGMKSAGPNTYQDFLRIGNARHERVAAIRYPFDVEPVPDDRPFFFKYSRWGHIVSDLAVVQASIPVLEYSLLALMGIVGIAVLLCVGVPLFLMERAGLRTPHAARHALYFAGIGLGYMAVEIALLQKFGLFLGHPNYALSVVLAGLLLFSGIGSLYSTRIVGALGSVRFVAYLLSAVLLVEHFLALPRLLDLIAWPFALRVAVVFVLVAPIGLLLGTFFPSGFDRLKAVAPPFASWAWGINGIFSVLGPILAVGVSATFGMNALLLASIPIYLAAAMALPDAGAS